jgi:putative ABC transport system substrate-binding protein
MIAAGCPAKLLVHGGGHAPTGARLHRRHWLRGGLALAGLSLLSGCEVLHARPQPPTANLPRIGYLAYSSTAEEAIRQGLRELGYVEGENILIESRYADADLARLSALAAELVRLNVDVIVTDGSLAAATARDATHTIPIVMPASGDPVRQGLATSLARPGGNVTGLTTQSASPLAQKRLQLLKELAPAISRITVLWNPNSAAKVLEFEETQTAASALGLTLQSAEVRVLGDFDSAFTTVAGQRPDALDALDEGLVESHFIEVAAFALTNRLPSISEARPFAAAGGLASYGPNIFDLNRRAATYVDRILKGAHPRELPIEQPTKFDFAVNLKTAQTLGITVPPAVLAQTTEVLQ